MREPRELTIREAGERMKAGKLTAERLVESCLERIQAREETIHAWVEVYEQAGPRGGTPLRPGNTGRQPPGTAPRHPHRGQGHHRRPGAVHPLRNAGLPGDASPPRTPR